MEKELKIEREVTSRKDMCLIGSCPAIFETNNGSYAIIGNVLDASKLGISKRLGREEVLIEIPKSIIDNKQ